MLGDIDLTLKVLNPQLWLCKPDKTEIAKLKHMTTLPQLKVNLGNVNELNFTLPFYVDFNHEYSRYKPIDQIRYRYLIKFVLGTHTEYFIVDKMNDQGDDHQKTKSVHAFSLSYQLRDKYIRNYSVTSKNLTDLANDGLALTNWTVGYVDPTFNSKYRTMDVTSQTVISFLQDCASTFEALIDFDTVSKQVNFYKLDSYGENKGLLINYGKYLKQINNTVDIGNVFTRIIPTGNNDLSIRGVNPTGQDYIDDFTPYIYPYTTDSNGNVTTHSYYMSDSLCKAILDYNKLVDDNKSSFSNLLSQQTSLQTTLTSQQNDMDTLNSDMASIQDNLDIQRSMSMFNLYSYIYNGSTVTNTASLISTDYYAYMIRVSDTANLTVKIDGTTKTLTSNQWSIFKISNASSTSVEVSGSATNVNVDIYVVNITNTEFTTSGNDTAILDKYNDKHKQDQIDAKQTDINNTQSQLDSVNSQISNLANTLDVNNNFTTDQLNELNDYVYVYEWTDTNYIDAQELYDDAATNLQKLNSPPTVINIDIVNFLEVVESQRDWNKLNIGDYVTIRYDEFGVKVTAQIIAIDYDFGNKSIKLTIANIKEVKNEQKKVLEQLYRNTVSSIAVDLNKRKWDMSTDNATAIDNILNNAWDATQREILAGVNESVTISGRGIIIKDSNDPMKMLIAQNSVIALSGDGGNTWRTALHPDGIYGDVIIGQILIGENLLIQNSSGKFTFDKDGVTIDGASFTITEGGNGVTIDPSNGVIITRSDNKVKTLLNATDGIKIQKSADSGTTWTDQFYVDTNGVLNAKGIIISSDSTIDGTVASTVVSNANNGNTANNTVTSNKATWDKAGNSVQQSTAYNGVTINTTNGLVVTRSDNKAKTILNATDGIKIQQSSDGVTWTDQFYVDTNGNATFSGTLSGSSGTFGTVTSVDDTTSYKNTVTLDKSGIDVSYYDKTYNNTNDIQVQNGSIYFTADDWDNQNNAAGHASASIYISAWTQGNNTVGTGLYIDATNSGLYIKGNTLFENDVTINGITHLGTSTAKIDTTGGNARWQQSDSNYIIQSSTGEIDFYMGGAYKHVFYPDGTKAGGSIEIDGQNLGMSPVDSPQVLIEYIEFNITLNSTQTTKVHLEPRYRKAVDHWDAYTFRNDIGVVEKGDDYFVLSSGTGTVSVRIVGERVGLSGTFFADLGTIPL